MQVSTYIILSQLNNYKNVLIHIIISFLNLLNILGINPIDLSGSNTAVFMSSCISESEFFEVFDIQERGFGLLGHNRAMQANRLSYTLNLNGEYK